MFWSPQHKQTPKEYTPDWLIVGLGNPGGEYENTRHNIGFRVLDAFTEMAPLKYQKNPWVKKVLVASCPFTQMEWPKLSEALALEKPLPMSKTDSYGSDLASIKLYFAKPLTYMNLSGQVVKPLCDRYQIAPERIMVLYDDVALPFGKIRVRPHGSAGGHNGMKSIIQSLGNDEKFPRVRLGVAPTQEDGTAKTVGGDGLRDFVLEDFSAREEQDMAKVLYGGMLATGTYILEGKEQAMQRINGTTFA